LLQQAEEETSRGECIAADGAKGVGATARDEEGREQEIAEET
jgi:hypothetical protein